MRIPGTAAAAALAALLIPATAHAAPAAAPGDSVTLPVRDAFAQLVVSDEDRTGYERTAFRHWVDADRDGCNTRAEMLKAEAVVAPEQGPGCKLSGGQWYSPYDDRYINGPSGLDIDHMVPLAEAWSPKEREAYANDLGDDRLLIAVSAASNRSKADQDPTTWLPPTAGYRCQYVTDWVADNQRWGLSIDTGDQPDLTQVLTACSNLPVTVTSAH
ncbi:HNH endonuclease family protein [Streptomyces sp. NPDC005890]|uniref:HNH endonuclease family protein n=1 Tax=Streptomyces sp. NPDC005890 TaxID=3154568 RepID=UPI0033F3E786